MQAPIFIAGLVFETAGLLDLAKAAVLGASLLAGFLLLRNSLSFSSPDAAR